MLALGLLQWIIILVQQAALFEQTSKIIIKSREPQGIRGISFIAFILFTFFCIPPTFSLILEKKSYSSIFLFISSIIAFVINCGFIIKYNKEEYKDDRYIKDSIAFSVLTFAGVVISILLTKYSRKLLKYFSLLSSFAIGLCFIPFTVRIYRKGDRGVSAIFIAVTLIANIVLFIGNLGFNNILALAMSLYIIFKSMCLARILQYSREHKDTPNIKHDNLDPTLKYKTVKTLIYCVGFVSLGLTILFIYLRNSKLKINFTKILNI